jgi:hypothetical protein
MRRPGQAITLRQDGVDRWSLGENWQEAGIAPTGPSRPVRVCPSLCPDLLVYRNRALRP